MQALWSVVMLTEHANARLWTVPRHFDMHPITGDNATCQPGPCIEYERPGGIASQKLHWQRGANLEPNRSIDLPFLILQYWNDNE